MTVVDEGIEWIEPDGSRYGGTCHGPDERIQNAFVGVSKTWEGTSVVPECFLDGGTISRWMSEGDTAPFDAALDA